MILFSSTSEITRELEYVSSSSVFFDMFSSAFENVRSQILKIETMQTYIEEGNLSYEAMRNGDWDLALSLIDKARVEDKDLYEDLSERFVDFIRCRPIQFPLSDYMKWELEIYKFNERYGERIYCCNYNSVKELFAENIHHDFMVFDSSVAFIHDYNQKGEICGGWITYELDHIIELQKLFIFLKSLSNPFTCFI